MTGTTRRLPGFRSDFAWWLAVRDDVAASQPALRSIQKRLAADDDRGVRAGADLSDVRLFDILAWS